MLDFSIVKTVKGDYVDNDSAIIALLFALVCNTIPQIPFIPLQFITAEIIKIFNEPFSPVMIPQSVTKPSFCHLPYNTAQLCHVNSSRVLIQPLAQLIQLAVNYLLCL